MLFLDTRSCSVLDSECTYVHIYNINKSRINYFCLIINNSIVLLKLYGVLVDVTGADECVDIVIMRREREREGE